MYSSGTTVLALSQRNGNGKSIFLFYFGWDEMLLPHELGLEWWQTDDWQRRPSARGFRYTQVLYEIINWRRNGRSLYENLYTACQRAWSSATERNERGWTSPTLITRLCSATPSEVRGNFFLLTPKSRLWLYEICRKFHSQIGLTHKRRIEDYQVTWHAAANYANLLLWDSSYPL